MQTCQIDNSGDRADVRDGDIQLEENARRVLAARYLKKDESGQCIEKPSELIRRVAKCVADAERRYDGGEAARSEWEDRFYRLMSSRRFMPNSPTLMNAGREMGMRLRRSGRWVCSAVALIGFAGPAWVCAEDGTGGQWQRGIQGRGKARPRVHWE